MEDFDGLWVFIGGILFCCAVTLLILMCGKLLGIYESIEASGRSVLYIF